MLYVGWSVPDCLPSCLDTVRVFTRYIWYKLCVMGIYPCCVARCAVISRYTIIRLVCIVSDLSVPGVVMRAGSL